MKNASWSIRTAHGGIITSTQLTRAAGTNVLDCLLAPPAWMLSPQLGPGRSEWRRVRTAVALPATPHTLDLADGEAEMLADRCDDCGHLRALHDDGFLGCLVGDCGCDS